MPDNRSTQAPKRGPRRVLVTGGSGMLGSHTVDRLIDLGVEEIVVVDRVVNEDNLRGALASGKVRTVTADVRDGPAMAAALKGCDTVIHLAALLMTASHADPRTSFDVNVAATHRLLSQSAEADIERFVLGSTVGVYGVPATTEVIDETHPIDARTFYGASKFSAELFCRAFCDTTGLSYVALRLGTLYGDRLHPGGFYPGQLLSLLDQRDLPSLTIHGGPDELHDFLYVGDAAEAVSAAACTGVHEAVVNVVSGRPVTWQEVINALLDATGRRPKIVWRPRTAHFAQYRRFDPRKATELLGFQPSTSLADGMRHLVEWHDRQPVIHGSQPTESE
jgi:UDP-glucose 4-epimerase